MHLRRIRFGHVVAAVALIACAPRYRARAMTDAPIAVITSDSAYFVFPAESSTQMRWNTPAPGRAAGSRDRFWSVRWAAAVVGTDSVTAISISRSYRPNESERVGSLAELLAEARGKESRPCRHCEIPNDVVSVRSEISARA